MLGFLFGSTKVNEDLEALLKSIEEIENEIQEEKNSLPEIIETSNADAEAEYLTDKILKLEDEVSELEKERSDLLEKRNGFDADLEQTKSEAIMVIRTLTEQNATREKQIQELQTDSQQCVDEYLKGFQKERETLANNQEDMKYMLDEEKKRLKEQLDELRFDIDAKQYEIEQLTEEMNNYDPNKPVEDKIASAPSQDDIEADSLMDETQAVETPAETEPVADPVPDIDDLEAPEEPELAQSTGCCGGCGTGDKPSIDQILEKLMAESDSDSGPEIEDMGDVEVRDEWDPMDQFEKFQAAQKGIPMEESNLDEDFLSEFRKRTEERRISSSSDSSVDTQNSQLSDSILR